MTVVFFNDSFVHSKFLFLIIIFHEILFFWYFSEFHEASGSQPHYFFGPKFADSWSGRDVLHKYFLKLFCISDTITGQVQVLWNLKAAAAVPFPSASFSFYLTQSNRFLTAVIVSVRLQNICGVITYTYEWMGIKTPLLFCQGRNQKHQTNKNINDSIFFFSPTYYKSKFKNPISFIDIDNSHCLRRTSFWISHPFQGFQM
jgi:hypothetical protein